MRAAAHVDALNDIFSGVAHPITAGVVTSSRIVVTTEILSQYASRLAHNPAYQAWFSAAYSANRITYSNEIDAPKRIKSLKKPALDYGIAGYFSAGNLFIAPTSLVDLDLKKLNESGIACHCITKPVPGNIDGDNPISTINLVNGGNTDLDILQKYFVAEDSIVVYDKYINKPGMELIEYIANILEDGSVLKVFTSRLSAKCLQPEAIAARLAAANPKIVSSCLEVSDSFRKLAHDRYVFCGRRLQLVFTAGIDSFGLKNSKGKRANRQSKINIYAVGQSSPINIEARNGTVCIVNGVAADLA